MKSDSSRPPLWTCPKCGHRFVTRNLWHSCGRYPLDDHFEGRDPVVREVFDRLVQILETFGPLTVYAQKTRIVCQVRVRFAGAITRRHALQAHLWLKRRAEHPRLRDVELLPPDNYIHRFAFDAVDQLDAAFTRLAREAYAIGEQRAGSEPSLPRRRTRV
jgi:hypothetical protein